MSNIIIPFRANLLQSLGCTKFNCESLSFDGVDDYVSLKNSSFGITGAFSLSAWVKIPSSNIGGGNANGIQAIVVEDNFGANRNWHLLWRHDNLSYQFAIWDATGAVKILNTTGIIPNDDLWRHILITYTGTTSANGIKMFINGVLEDSDTSANGGLRSLTAALPQIGQIVGQGYRFQGLVDEVALFDTDQSANVATLSTAPTVDLTSLNPLAWYRNGDGDTYPTITDNGSGGNDGTMTNMDAGDIVSDVPL